MSSPAPKPVDLPEEAYDLYTRSGAPGFGVVLKLADHGVSLVGDRIAWMAGDRHEDAPLTNIASIHLYTGAQTISGPIGATFCQIRFKNGSALTIYGTDGLGFADQRRAGRYRAFVQALHKRLSPALRSRIQFVAGYGSARYVVLLVMSALWSALLLGAVVAVFVLGELRLRTVIALVLGGSMLVALVKLLQQNAPHAYDPSNPLDSAETGSISGTIAHAFAEFRRTLTPRRAGVLAALGAVVVVIAILVIGAQGSANLFEPRRARHAFETILAAEPQRKITKVEVTTRELMVRFPDVTRDSSAVTEWRASRASLFGWSEWDRVSGPRVNYNVSVGEDAEEEPFDAQADDAANLAELAEAAIARAGLGDDGAATSMVLTKKPDYYHPEPPHWTVRIESAARTVEVFADRRGQLFPAVAEPAGPPRIVIRAVSDSWMRIINPDRSIRYDGILKSGTSYSVPDVPGLVLRTGKPDGLVIAVDGQAVPPIGSGLFVQVEAALDPQALLDGTAARK